MENAGLYSLNDLGRRSGIATTTVAALVYGRRQSDERTIQQVADAMRLPVTTIREWAATTLGEAEPFKLPAEANRLNRRQRAAVIELVRSMIEPVDDPPAPDLSRVQGLRLAEDAGQSAPAPSKRRR